jgi:hypothetical protein
MFAGSLVLGTTLLCFAAWLHWSEMHGWPDEQFVTELDHRYLARRQRSRRRIHLIIAVCGGLMIVAAFAGPGPVWLAAWMTIIVSMMTVVVLAGFDAWRTHRYHQDKLPEIRRQLLGDDEPPKC